MRNLRRLIVLAVLTLGFGLSATLPVRAASPKPLTGISLSPPLQQVSLQPGEAQKSFTVQLINHTASLQELTLAVRDFGSLNDTGGVLLEGSSKYTQKYGLASWLTLEKSAVNLNPGESANILATIENRTSLQPGGHYGAIVVSVNSLDPATGNRVVINQQLLSLVLVDKVGGDHFDLKLESVSHNGNWLHLPSDVKLRFQNPGNVHVIPRGQVKLVSPSGTVLAQGIINDESAFVLPESFRVLYVHLTTVNKSLPLPGLYHLEVNYRYDGLDKAATKNYTLNFIDLGLYIVLALLLSVSGWIIWRRRPPKTKPKTAKKPSKS